jgi:hypothetical protein
VTDFYTIDRANDRLEALEPVLTQLRDQRDELRELKVAFDATEAGPEHERLRLRMQGVIDQMQAGVVRIDSWKVSLRDIATGLVDFPALASGRQVWLCWRLGEADVAWWHELEAGVAGRQALIDLK